MDTRNIEIIRKHLNAMLDELALQERGEGSMTSASVTTTRATTDVASIPSRWTFVESRDDESYSWPELEEEYDPFEIYQGHAPNGDVSQWAIGKCDRAKVWGKDRLYSIVFRLGEGGGSKQPICEFLEADDYEQSRDFVAIIRGSGGPRGQRMFDPDAELPSHYDGMRIEVYGDRIAGTPELSGWNKQAVVAREDDHESMLRHAAIQVHLRHS